MAITRAKLKDKFGLEPITQKLNNNEIIKNAKERLVHTKDMDHDTIPTTNHIQLLLDNIKKGGGKRSDLGDELLKAGYNRDVVKKIMDQIDIYDW